MPPGFSAASAPRRLFSTFVLPFVLHSCSFPPGCSTFVGNSETMLPHRNVIHLRWTVHCLFSKSFSTILFPFSPPFVASPPTNFRYSFPPNFLALLIYFPVTPLSAAPPQLYFPFFPLLSPVPQSREIPPRF